MATTWAGEVVVASSETALFADLEKKREKKDEERREVSCQGPVQRKEGKCSVRAQWSMYWHVSFK